MRHANIIGKIAPHIHGNHATVSFIDLPHYMGGTWVDNLRDDLVALRDKESSAAREQHAWDNHSTARQHSQCAANVERLLNNLPKETFDTNTITVTFTAQAQSMSDYLNARRTFDDGESLTHAEDPYHVIREYQDDVAEAYQEYQTFVRWLTVRPCVNNILRHQRWNVVTKFRVLPAA